MKYSKHVLLAVALVTLGSGAAITASAQSSNQTPNPAPNAAPPAGGQGPHHGFGRFRGPRGAGGPFVATLLRAVREEGKTTPALALTVAQRQQIRTLVKASFKTGAANHPGVDVTVVGNPGSSGYAGAVQGAQSTAASRVLNESNLATQIYQQVLTAKQQQALPVALQALQTKAQERRAAWLSRHPHSSNG